MAHRAQKFRAGIFPMILSEKHVTDVNNILWMNRKLNPRPNLKTFLFIYCIIGVFCAF